MTWFTKLTGIDEESPTQVRREMSVDGQHLVCPDGKRIAFGRLETPNLSELRKAVTDLNSEPRRSTIREIVGDVRKLHTDPANASALFQVASQFNLLPVAYGRQPPDQWTDFAKLILDAAYEATLCAAIINVSQTGNSTVYLTLLGGGVFGNRDEWITDAIERAFFRHKQQGLDVQIVSYGQSRRAVTNLIERIGNTAS